jgi:plasmid replication initiation protein
MEEDKLRWVERIRYSKTQGCIELSLTQSILPYLTALSREFTQYRLQHVVGLPTVYSIRLYELLVQWRSVGERELEVAWLRERFQLAGKYPMLKDFKRWVVDPSVAQINEHTDIWVKYTQKKRGRVIWSFIFTFGPKSEKKPDPEKPAPNKRLTQKEMASVARPGESWEELKRRLGVGQ